MLLLAFAPTPILLLFWSGLRSWRTRRREAAKLMAQAAEQFGQGENTAALATNSRVLALDPACAQALVLRGILCIEAGRYREAIRDFDQAIASMPRSTLAIYRRAIAKHCLGDLDGAIADYDRVMALEPECADSQPLGRRRRRVASKQ